MVFGNSTAILNWELLDTSYFVSKLSNLSVNKLSVLVPSTLALVAATVFLSQQKTTTAMAAALQQPPVQQAAGATGSPPSLKSSKSSLSLASSRSFASANDGTKRWNIVPPATKQIHVVILIHGWLGTPSEMGSIQQALEKQIEKATDNNNEEDNNDDDDDNSSTNSLPSLPPEGAEEQENTKEEATIPEGTFFVVHSAECNEGKTVDGITAGGGRVAKEVNQIIKELLEGGGGSSPGSEDNNEEETKEEEEGEEASDNNKNNNISDASVSISFIGNSLGGLYARSALADIEWDLVNGKTLVPNVFVTTCTPHLGKRGLTYIKIPRFAEQGIGYALQPTGQDLFGLNRVVEDLATQSKYVNPLKRFAKRVAYANAFGTDLQVPTSTAAFLADTESPHETEESNPPFLLKVTTPRDDKVLESIVEATCWEDISSTPPAHIPATTMARALDAMGWTKVFCDVRDKLLSVPVPFREKESDSSEFTKKDEWTSHELKEVIASRIVHDKKWPLPWGHQMMIANSKNEFFAKLNQGGLPFVNQLTTEFLEDVLKCK